MEKEELFLASCKQGDYTQFYKLYQSGVDVNMRGGEALREAITNSHVMIWTLLLSSPEIDLRLKDENGRSALHVACWYNKETAVAKLISTSEVLNEKDFHGNTPIMMAAKYASKGVMMVLLNDPRVDLEAVDNMGRDLCQMIRESWRLSTQEKLEMEDIIIREKRRRIRESEARNVGANEVEDEESAIINMKNEVLTALDQFSSSLNTDDQKFTEKLQAELSEFQARQVEEERRLLDRQEKDRSRLRGKQRQEETELETQQVKEVYKLKLSQSKELEEMNERQRQQRAWREVENSGKFKSILKQMDKEEVEGSSSPGPSLRSSLLREAECPVCLQEMTGRIMQCESGHLLCEHCHHRPEVTSCPTCRAPFMGRATAVEQMVKTIRALSSVNNV